MVSRLLFVYFGLDFLYLYLICVYGQLHWLRSGFWFVIAVCFLVFGSYRFEFGLSVFFCLKCFAGLILTECS